jgi:hypothetical protein
VFEIVQFFFYLSSSSKQLFMKSLGTLLFLFGAAAIIFGFMDKVPRLLEWIYKWGEGTAWAIKIGFVVVGALIYIMAGRQSKKTNDPGQS